jgi:ABC-type branched-subunit amino acid transport system substrate-binding protein
MMPRNSFWSKRRSRLARLRALGAVTVAAALTGAVAGCGSSSSSGGTGTGSSGQSHSPISIMASIPLNSTVVELPGIQEAITAAVDKTNATGGLDGHPVKLIMCDNGYNAAETQSCAAKAVQDHVLAMVSSFTPYGSLVYPELAAADIPNIGDFPASNADLTNNDSWVALGDAESQYAGAAYGLAKQTGCKKMGLLTDDVPSVQAYEPYWHDGAAMAGATVGKSTVVPATAVDMAPYVADQEAKNVQCIGLNMPDAPAAITAVDSSGKKVPVAAIGVAILAGLPTLGKAANGVIISTPILPPTLTPAASAPPMAKLFASEMKKYEPGKPGNATQLSFGIQGWEAYQMLVAAAKGLPDLNSKALIASLNKLDWKPGISGEADYAKPGPVPALPRLRNTYMWIGTAENGKFVLTTPQPVNVGSSLKNVSP